MERKPLIVLIVGVAAYLAYIFIYIGIDRLVHVLAGVRIVMIAVSIAFLLISILLHGLSWHILLGREGKGVSMTISTTVVGLFASYVAPIGAASELARLFIATRILRIGAASTVLSILVHRLSITLAPLVVLTSLVLYLKGDLIVVDRAAIITIMALYMLAIVFPNMLAIGLIGTRVFEKLVRRYEKHLSRIIGSDVSNFPEEYRRSMASMISRPRFPLALGISLIEWLFLVASMYSIFIALSLNKDLVIAVASIILIQILWWILPISFAGSIGIADLLASIAYQLLSFGPDVSASIVIIYRLASITALVILLYPSLRILGIYPREIGKIYREGRDKRTGQFDN